MAFLQSTLKSTSQDSSLDLLIKSTGKSKNENRYAQLIDNLQLALPVEYSVFCVSFCQKLFFLTNLVYILRKAYSSLSLLSISEMCFIAVDEF